MIQQQEQEKQQHEQQQEQQQIRDNMLKMITARKTKVNNRKYNRIIHLAAANSATNLPNKDTELFGMKMTVDLFGDRWHKYIMYIFVGQRIEALFGDVWHKQQQNKNTTMLKGMRAYPSGKSGKLTAVGGIDTTYLPL